MRFCSTASSRHRLNSLHARTVLLMFVAAACSCAQAGRDPNNNHRFTTITGSIIDHRGQPFAGVVVRSEPGGKTGVTDSTGAYAIRLSSNWHGTIVPSRRCTQFAPAAAQINLEVALQGNTEFVSIPDRKTPGCSKPPIAQAGENRDVDADVESGVANVTLDASQSFDPDGEIVDYAWFSEESELSHEKTVDLQLPVGLHRIVLRVEDDGGAIGESSITITVRGRNSDHRLYVSPDPSKGSDMNPGTEAMPLRTIARAARYARPGDTITLLAGTYKESDIRFTNNGLPEAPITIEGREGDEVILTTGSTSRWIFDFTPKYSLSRPDQGHYVFRRFKAHGASHVWRFAFPGQSGQPKPHHITIEDVEAWDCSSVIAARRGGVANITIRRCDFHDCNGTEGAIDFSNNVDDLETPGSASHDILIEDCSFHDNNAKNKINGLVTQGGVRNVTIRRSRCWNNANYGFALKGSGSFVLDRCVSFGNGSAQYYLRGMVADDPVGRRTNARNSHLLTNCIGIGPRNGGSGVIIWRENTDIRLLNCTIVALRDEKRTKSGGPFGNGERRIPPYMACTAEFRNCIIATLDGGVMWFLQQNGLAFLQNRSYYGDHNLFHAYGDAGTTLFRYQDHRWRDVTDWSAYWSRGEPNGDDQLAGPRATGADAHSILADPGFMHVILEKEKIPLAREWPADFRKIIDPTPRPDSPLVDAGENLSTLGLSALELDYTGETRPQDGPWTIGAIDDAGMR